MDETNKVLRLGEMFGSLADLGRVCGVARSTVSARWAKRNAVPTQYNVVILTEARRLKLDMNDVSRCLDPHVCPSCGAPLEPGTTRATVTG